MLSHTESQRSLISSSILTLENEGEECIKNVSKEAKKILSEGDAGLDWKMITWVWGSGKYTYSNTQISKKAAENTDLIFGLAVKTGNSDFSGSKEVVFEAMRTKLRIN